ncbi:Reverse transcriptase [Phytophthora palmivora]|uniref:Reverse transcriptase n=1 Tax=Phytophthora palmivora TaxID=4796 RepID=A0A2P4XGP4_9STRA|nr:Reverse transcriptase [Phytophthora palmivora]
MRMGRDLYAYVDGADLTNDHWETQELNGTSVTKWLSLANYLHKYSAGYAELAQPLSDHLKTDAD